MVHGHLPGFDGLVRVGWTDDLKVGDGAQRGEVFDGLMSGAVFADAHGVVGEHEHHLGAAQSSEPHGRTHVVEEDEERAAGWQNTDYQLGSRDYLDMILGVADALELVKPVAIGCSIGGRIALHLALEHPERFRAIIGLQAGAHVDPYYDLGWLHRPDVHGGEVCAGIVSGLVGPGSPEAHRWETIWHYMQGGPGVFKGDLYFYTIDGDMRGRLGDIDTRRCPLYLLSGEYDYSCAPDDTRDLARRIKGTQAVIMEGLGHFPMSEDPARFLTYLLPVLDEIRRR